jgi:hypothetical protein
MTGVLQHQTPSEPKSFPVIPRHHRGLVTLVVMAALECGGCGFKGAIYSSYQEGGLGVRTTAEGDAPIKVHFGYDRSVAAFVPRRGGNADTEEATALISKDQVGANLNPLRMGTDNVLTVDSAFITGTTAIVASAPHDSIVIVKAPPTVGTNAGGGSTAAAETGGALGETPGTGAEKAGGRERAAPGSLEFRTRGSAGERIGLAFTQQPGRLSTCAVSILALQKKIGTGSKADEIYDKAAGKLPDDFKKLYQARSKKGRTAFLLTKQDYLEGQPEDGARCQAINQALNAVLEGK